MLDIKLLREKPDFVIERLSTRNQEFPVREIIRLDDEWRKLHYQADQLKAERNKASIQIPQEKDAKKKQALITETRKLADSIKEADDKKKLLKEKIDSLMLLLPNLPLESVPSGKQPKFSFKPKPHWELDKDLGILDIETSAAMTGAGFYILKGKGARLERALINFFLDFHKKNGLTEACVPILVNDKAMFNAGQLPKFEQDLYKTREGYYLIPTSEVPLANLHAGQVFDPEELPKRYCSFTPCFRVEAGRHGTE
ncbi:serine--tRNA ligase, partial [archaeon]|nr:serine--tRNA ligase [archaeon]